MLSADATTAEQFSNLRIPKSLVISVNNFSRPLIQPFFSAKSVGPSSDTTSLHANRISTLNSSICCAMPRPAMPLSSMLSICFLSRPPSSVKSPKSSKAYGFSLSPTNATCFPKRPLTLPFGNTLPIVLGFQNSM